MNAKTLPSLLSFLQCLLCCPFFPLSIVCINDQRGQKLFELNTRQNRNTIRLQRLATKNSNINNSKVFWSSVSKKDWVRLSALNNILYHAQHSKKVGCCWGLLARSHHFRVLWPENHARAVPGFKNSANITSSCKTFLQELFWDLIRLLELLSPGTAGTFWGMEV